MAVAGGARARNRLGFEHTGFSATGEACGQDNRKLSGRTKMVLGSGSPIVPISPVGMDGGSSSVVPQVSGARKHGRGMRPARGNRQFPQRVNDELTGERENTRKVPLSVQAEESSLKTVPKIWVNTEEGSDGRGECIPSRDRHAGAPAPVALAGTSAGTDVPAIAGMKFSAVAEVHSSAIDDEGDHLVISTSRQRSAVVILDPYRGR